MANSSSGGHRSHSLAYWLRNTRRRGRKTHAAPTYLGEVLSVIEPDALRGTGGAPLDSMAWLEVAGPRIAAKSTPVRLESDGTLMIAVVDSVWSQELSLLSTDIIARLNAQGLAVTKLRFRVGAVERPRELPTMLERRQIPQAIELPSELAAELERVEDPVLRQLLATVASASLARNLKKSK